MTSRPSSRTWPAFGLVTPVRRLISVVLPGAVGADQRLPGAGRNRERDIVGGDQRAEIALKTARLERRSGHATPRRAARGANEGDQPPGRFGDPLAAGEHENDQREADPELPIFGRRRRNHVPQHDERRRADDAAIEISRPADDEHQHHVGRAVEVEEIERDDLRRLRQKRARRAGVSRGKRIDRNDAPAGVDAERAGAQAVLPDRGQRQPEWRLGEATGDRKQDEEDRKAVERRVALPGEADRKEAENGRDREVEPVRAAGEPAVAVGELSEHQRDAERHHEPGQVGAAQEEGRGGEADDRGDGGAEDKPERRVGEALAGQNRRRIGAEAEKRRMPERDDSGQSQDEIERQGEQAGDQHFIDDRRPRRRGEDQEPGSRARRRSPANASARGD